MGIQLDQIIPWGRTRWEYELMFHLSAEDLAGSLQDCGGGPASFVAEVTSEGRHAVAVDPLYAHTGDQIRARFETIAPEMLRQIQANPTAWVWQYHRSPEDLLANRRKALECFLADYELGQREQRYLTAELPHLPFAAGTFRLALCSHLLFLYSEQLSAEFHVQSVRELCRVADEVRIFPLLTLKGQLSPYLEAVQTALTNDGYICEISTVDYELQPGGNQMLRLRKP